MFTFKNLHVSVLQKKESKIKKFTNYSRGTIANVPLNCRNLIALESIFFTLFWLKNEQSTLVTDVSSMKLLYMEILNFFRSK